jgi:predicted SprT family Zn-dependent metalloprotease
MGRTTGYAPAQSRGRASDNERRSGRHRDALLRSVRTAIGSGILAGETGRFFRRWSRCWHTPEIVHEVVLRTNPRLRTTFARWVIAAHCLELGPRFFELRTGHDEVLCHEFAHAAALRLYGPAVPPHGAEWRDLVSRAGYTPAAHRALPRKPDRYRPQARPRIRMTYEHRCAVCQAVRYGRRPVKSWRCPTCVASGLPGNLSISVVAPGTGAR